MGKTTIINMTSLAEFQQKLRETYQIPGSEDSCALILNGECRINNQPCANVGRNSGLKVGIPFDGCGTPPEIPNNILAVAMDLFIRR